MRISSFVVAILFVITGCAHGTKRASTPTIVEGISPATYVESIDARATPPVGWRADPLKSSADHTHQVWISPNGHTAYGVIRFDLPLPVGHELPLWGFLYHMKQSEGEARLISKRWDPELEAIRFVAEGGLYTVRTNLFVRGVTGWAVYAGTLRAEAIDPQELALAERARELTVIGH